MGVGQLIGKRDISDHCPVWIMINNLDWGPKPFKFNESWFRNKDFVLFVEKELKDMNVQGRSDYVIKEKLRLLKGRLRWRNSEVFGRINIQVKDGKEEINEVDELLSFCKENQVAYLVNRRSIGDNR